MQIRIYTDHRIEDRERLSAQVNGAVGTALNWIRDHVTRVEVHLSDESSHNESLNDKCCMMEARLEGYRPMVVTHRAEDLDQAVDGAVGKLTSLIDNTFGWLRDNERSSLNLPPTEPELTVRS